MRLAGLGKEFRDIARYEDQGTRLFDRGGALHFEEEGEAADFDRPEVDRTALRQILLDSLPPGLVRWGHRLMTIEPRDDGTFELAFEGGHAEAFDLVVGADGTRSRVRPLVSAAVPAYTGVSFASLGFDDVDERHSEIARLVGHGMLFAMGENRGLIAHRDANAHVGVYVALSVPEGWVTSGVIDPEHPDDAKAKLAEYFVGWSPKLLAMIRESGDRIAVLPLYALPVGHRWENRPGVTLLGDAAHVMTPFSGEGVNLAMIDAADLAIALADAEDWRAAVRSYEESMFVSRGDRGRRGGGSHRVRVLRRRVWALVAAHAEPSRRSAMKTDGEPRIMEILLLPAAPPRPLIRPSGTFSPAGRRGRMVIPSAARGYLGGVRSAVAPRPQARRGEGLLLALLIRRCEDILRQRHESLGRADQLVPGRGRQEEGRARGPGAGRRADLAIGSVLADAQDLGRFLRAQAHLDHEPRPGQAGVGRDLPFVLDEAGRLELRHRRDQGGDPRQVEALRLGAGLGHPFHFTADPRRPVPRAR